MTLHSFGLIGSPVEAKGNCQEKLYGSVSDEALPSELSYLKFLHDTRNQQGTSSCVAQAIAHANYIREGIQGDADRKLASARYIYMAALKASGRALFDKGVMPVSAFEAISIEGYPTEEDFPFSEADILKPIPWGVGQAGFSQRSVQYQRVDSYREDRCQDVKKALASGFPVVYGTVVDPTFDSYTGGLLAPPSGKKLGSHMLCAFGYNSEGIYGINSWGPDWGEHWSDDTRTVGGGIFRASWETIASDLLDDFWYFTRSPVIQAVA